MDRLKDVAGVQVVVVRVAVVRVALLQMVQHRLQFAGRNLKRAIVRKKLGPNWRHRAVDIAAPIF